MAERGQIDILVNGHGGGYGVTEVAVVGEVDAATAPRLKAALLGALQHGDRGILVDLRGVGLIDASGIGVLVEAARRARHEGVTLELRAPSQAVRRVLDAVELNGALPIAE